MKRLKWTLGMALVGLFLGLKSSDGTPADGAWTALGVVWAGAIGYGIGSIFDRRRPTLYLIECWTGTFALLGAVFGSLVPLKYWVAQYAVAGLLGALFGVLCGSIHLRRRRRLVQTSKSVPMAELR